MKDFIVKPSNIHGFGCFAARNFVVGEQICVNVLVKPKSDVSSIVNHTFPWGREESSIVLSELTYCNASSDPNLKIFAIDKANLTKTFLVMKNIDVGDELLLKYKV